MLSPAERFDRSRQRMDAARRELEAVLTALEPALWSQPAAPGRWSVSQVLQHLQLVEAKILEATERALVRAALPRPDWHRFFHLPVSWVESRTVRVKTFPPFEPQSAASPGQVLADLHRVRQRLLSLLDAHREHDLRGLCGRHPFLGFLDGYAWMAYLAAHERRHLKQIKEIVATLCSSGARVSRQ